MIWMTWRQHRAQAVAAAILIALTAAVFLTYGASIRTTYAQDGIAPCLIQGTGAEHCQSVMSAFLQQFNGIDNHLLTWFTPIPGLIGAIVGASVLGREYEHDTWRLAWTQAVPKTRWLTTRVLLVGAGIAVLTASLSAIFAWFRSPVDTVSGRFTPGAFDLEGLSLTGYTLFAFAAGVLAGLVLRRTVPAIVTAFAAFMAVRLTVEFWLRPMYRTPVTRLLAPRTGFNQGALSTPTSPGTQGWILSHALVDNTGHPLSPALQEQVIEKANSLKDTTAADSYLSGLGLHLQVVYQPADRFWTFQIIEAALFTTLAAALIAIAVRHLHRRSG